MIRFGSLELTSNLFLSPLAGYTNLPFRRVVREIGGVDLCTTDLVNARSLIERNRKALKLIESDPWDRPLAVQLFGSVPEEMRDAALQFVRKVSGYTHPSKANETAFYAAVDDVEKVVRRMLKELETDAPKRDREVLIARAREKAKERYARAG